MPNTQPLSRNITRSNTSITTTVKVICEEKNGTKNAIGKRQRQVQVFGIRFMNSFLLPDSLLMSYPKNTGFIGNETNAPTSQ